LRSFDKGGFSILKRPEGFAIGQDVDIFPKSSCRPLQDQSNWVSSLPKDISRSQNLAGRQLDRPAGPGIDLYLGGDGLIFHGPGLAGELQSSCL